MEFEQQLRETDPVGRQNASAARQAGRLRPRAGAGPPCRGFRMGISLVALAQAGRARPASQLARSACW